MYDQINESSDTERLADVFIALVQESALLNLENIQKVRSYARFLLADQQTEEAPVSQTYEKKGSADKSPRNGSTTHCAFCGRPDDQVQRMIQGPGICICDECVYLCLQVLLVPLDS